MVDIRADAPNAPDSFDRLAELLKDEFPKKTVRNEITAELKLEKGRLLAPQSRDLGPHGLHLSNSDGTLVVQFRRDGFTLNNVKSFIGRERLIERALSFWGIFTSNASIGQPSRVAIRYINKLELRLIPGVDFRHFLTSSPDMPTQIPDYYSEFLMRVVALTENALESPAIIVTQSLGHEGGKRSSLESSKTL